MLDKVALGKKYTCFKCQCKFYDLNREEPLCPRCGADQREDPNPDPREAFLDRFRRPVVAPVQAVVPDEEEETARDIDVPDFDDAFADEEFGDGELIEPELGEEDFAPAEEEESDDESGAKGKKEKEE